MRTIVLVWSYLSQFCLKWEMFRTKVVEKIKTHFMFNNPSPLPENHAVYDVMWKNMVDPDRLQMTM